MAFSDIENIDYRSIGQMSQEGSFPPFDGINPKSPAFVRALSAIFASTMMLPVDRIAAKKIVGQPITRRVVLDIAKKPLEGGIPRLTNSYVGSSLTYGGSAALYPHLRNLFPTSSLLTPLSLAGGSLLDRIVTAPLATVVLRMQTQDKTFFNTLFEILDSKTPWRSLYTGTPSLMIKDLLYLPICIPLAEKLRNLSPTDKPSPLIDFFRATLAFTIGGIAASAVSYPFQYIGLVQKDSLVPLSAKQVFAKTLKENGFFGFYRGYKLTTLRIALFNSFFGGGISIGERTLQNLS